jgi:hypothetical protein
MALKRISQLPSFNGVAASQTATLDLPVGPRYHVIWLVADNTGHDTALTIISQIRVKVNGKVQRTMTATQLNALNTLMQACTATHGTSATFEYAYHDSGTTNMIPIFFAEPWRPEIVSKEGLAWATGDLSTFQIEVDISSGAGPTLSAFAEVDNAVVTTEGVQRAQPMGPIVKWNRFNIPFTGAGVLNVQTIPRRDVILQLSLWHTADAHISEYQVKADNYEWRNLTELQNACLLRSRGMTPTVSGDGAAYRTDIVFDYDDFPPGAGLRADNIQDLQFNLTLAGTCTPTYLTAILQTLGRPD